MGGKKKGKGGKKGGKQDNPLANLSQEQQYNARLVEWKSLQQILIRQTEDADRQRAAENQLRGKVTVLSNDLQEEKTRTWDVTCDMTRQYKSMQQQKEERIEYLQQAIAENTQKLEQRDLQLNEIVREKDAILKEKDEEIHDLNTKIEKMSQQFAIMLKETHDQMKEKIEMVNRNWEEEMETPMLKKLEEFAS